ncbi:MAG: ATP-binding protein [Pyrinomonadaceae bacterium]
MTAISIIALLTAILSAWRTAQMSETFVYRQAESNVSAAVRELLRENRDFPNGRNDSLAKEKERKLLPHEREIFSRYDEPFARSAAIALHRFPETAGGFCTTGGDIQEFIIAENFGANFTAQERESIANVCRQVQTAQDLKLQKINVSDKVLLVSAAPSSFEVDANETYSDLISGAFAVRQLSAPSGFGDRFSLLTQGFLLIVVVGLAGFSFLTWRDWQSGMKLIENGMRQIPGDLQARIVAPPMPELEKISDSINDLAVNLDGNLSRQKELEYSLIRNEKLAALGRVAAGVAHEVRNPLASMKLKIQLAERNKLEPEKLGKTFDVLREEINRLDNLVKKLLDVSRPAKLNLSQISLIELIEQRFSLFSEQAAAQNVHFEFYKSSESAEVIADRERLTQLFDNLFKNALEAMPDGGKLKVSLEKALNNYLIKFLDDGKGLTETEREQLFEPFFTTKDNGTGLGLTISREIIEAHGGKIYTLSGVENGATFIVELPLLREDN